LARTVRENGVGRKGFGAVAVAAAIATVLGLIVAWTGGPTGSHRLTAAGSTPETTTTTVEGLVVPEATEEATPAPQPERQATPPATTRTTTRAAARPSESPPPKSPSTTFLANRPARPIGRGDILFGHFDHVYPTQDELSVWAMHADGSGLVKVLDGTNEASWSPDRKSIAFWRYGSHKNGIFLYDVATAGVRQLTTDDDSDPAISRDGSRIAYTHTYGSPKSTIVVRNIDGSGQPQTITPADDAAIMPAWSPDGGRIAFAMGSPDGTSGIYTAAADGSDRKAVVVGSSSTSLPAYRYPAWSPDGSLLAFTGTPPLAKNTAIGTVRPDGSGLTFLTSGDATDWAAAWSPDGTSLVFGRYQGDPMLVATKPWVMRRDGTGVHQISDFTAFQPSWG
jgi:hypothetical protein